VTYLTKKGVLKSGKKPGPARGSSKVAGSGRKRRDHKAEALQTIWQFVTRGLNGEPVKQAGPTGKQISKPLTQDNQVKLLTTAWKKLEPDLNATAVKAEIDQTVNPIGIWFSGVPRAADKKR